MNELDNCYLCDNIADLSYDSTLCTCLHFSMTLIPVHEHGSAIHSSYTCIFVHLLLYDMIWIGCILPRWTDCITMHVTMLGGLCYCACDHAERSMLICLWPRRADYVIMLVTTWDRLCCYACDHVGQIMLLWLWPCQADYVVIPMTTSGLHCYVCDHAVWIMILRLWPRWAGRTLNLPFLHVDMDPYPRVILSYFSLDGVHADIEKNCSVVW